MVKEFDLPEGLTGDVTIVNELDDGGGHLPPAWPVLRAGTKAGRRRPDLGDTILRLLQALAGCRAGQRRPAGQPDAPGQEPGGAGSYGAGLPDRRRGDGRGHPARRDTASPSSSWPATSTTGCAMGSLVPSFDTGVWGMGPPAAAGRDRADLGRRRRARASAFRSTSAPRSTATARTSAGPCMSASPRRNSSRVYDTVMEAQAAGIRAARPGVPASAVHAATRQVIVDAGLGEWFRHRTGHCIGLGRAREARSSPRRTTPRWRRA